MSNEPAPENLEESVKEISLNVIESQERANVDMLVSTAKHFPRNIVKAVKNMVAMATLDEDTALSMHYRLKRKDKIGKEVIIEGPSVRLAEIAHSCWGNMRSATQVIGNDGKTVTSQAYAHDLENNTFVAVQVQRRITGRDGRTFSDDMIVVTSQAGAAIAWRNAVLKVIPASQIKQVSEAAKKAAFGGIKSISERWQDSLKRFKSIGVTEVQLLNLLKLESPEEITVEELHTLFGVFNAIKEGSTTVDEQFPREGVASKPVFGNQTATEQSFLPEENKQSGPPKPKK